ncbi:MAG: hypothetical protein M1820_008173 [Bogoriella megaspora]|nr:MAG: hypothetical protein M1820_008173 [Bogoriella megaspora]
MEQIWSSVSNSSLVPSAKDFLLAGPRLASYAIFTVPEQLNYFLGKLQSEGSAISEATMAELLNASGTSLLSESGADASLTPQITANATGTAVPAFSSNPLGFDSVRNFGGMFSYVTSKWAIATLTIFVILNRTQFYASPRVGLNLHWCARILLYCLPIMIFVQQIHEILQAMKCQTSQQYPLLRYSDPMKSVVEDYAGEGGFLYNLSSVLLFWEDDASACAARNMIPTNIDTSGPFSGSLSLLWPLFLSFCTGQFFDTLACALQGRQHLLLETGMTIFEHSLAFAETETMMRSTIKSSLTNLSAAKESKSIPAIASVSRSVALQTLNAPPEVLLVALISSFSHLSSYVLASADLRTRFRLVNTGIWGVCYMATFLTSIWNLLIKPSAVLDQLGFVRFPTVCIIGFMPHLLITIGVSVCAVIYALAFLVTVIAPPNAGRAPLSLRQRFLVAYQNLQANVYLSISGLVRVNWTEDFYSALLRTGFTILTAASEAVYLKEGQGIRVGRRTWLEQRRLGHFVQRREEQASLRGSKRASAQKSSNSAPNTQAGPSSSGYGIQRRARGGNGLAQISLSDSPDNGVGLIRRRGRWRMSFNFFTGIFWLMAGVVANLLHRLLRVSGIDYRPQWLVQLRRGGLAPNKRRNWEETGSAQGTPPQWHHPRRPHDPGMKYDENTLDVERLTRERLAAHNAKHGNNGEDWNEDALDEKFYAWWLDGGIWGNADDSGEYVPRQEPDDDATSLISTVTNVSATDEWVDEDDDGQLTPTQLSRRGSGSPDDALDAIRLAELLDPKTPSDAAEARMLAQRLRSDKLMTRSQYQRAVDHDKLQLLLNSPYQSHSARDPKGMTPREEEMLLETFLKERREAKRAQAASQSDNDRGSWNNGGEGLGSSGPACVVCHSDPRTILVWPCGCLSVCDDCRVGLATRNFTSCVCCRAEVGAYSRLFVP